METKQYEKGFTEENIIERLASLGYTYNQVADSFALGLIIEKVKSHICNNCNLLEIPEGLYEKAIDMVCGEFLKGKYSQGLLDIETAVSSIKEGDTDIKFVTGSTPEENYLKLINTLASDTVDFARYRKMSW